MSQTYIIKNEFKIVMAIGRWQAHLMALKLNIKNPVLVRVQNV